MNKLFLIHRISRVLSIGFSVFIFFLAQASIVYAQSDVKELSLEEAMNKALENNRNISLSHLDERIAHANYKQTDAIFLPQVNVSVTAMTTNNPLHAFGSKLQQQSITQNDFNPVLLNNPSNTADFMSKVDALQPLFNLDLLYQRKSAFKQTELYQFKTLRTQEYITFQVQQSYLHLQLMYESKKVIEEALASVNAMLKLTKDRYDQGLLQKSDVLNVEVQVKTTENSLSETETFLLNASDQLSLLMNVPLGVVYKTDDYPSVTIALSNPVLSDNRADFKAIEAGIASYDLLIKGSKSSYLPRLNAFGNYQFNDRKMLGFGAEAYTAGIQLSWDVFKGTQNRHKIASQSFERNKLEEELSKHKEESSSEIASLKRQLNDLSFKLKQQELTVELANESLRILENRYQQGLANTTDVMFAQTQLSQQKLLYQQSIYAINVSVAYLNFLTKN